MPPLRDRRSWFLPGGRAGRQRQRAAAAAAQGAGEAVPVPARELGVGGVAAAVDVAVGLQAVLGRAHQVGGLH